MDQRMIIDKIKIPEKTGFVFIGGIYISAVIDE